MATPLVLAFVQSDELRKLLGIGLAEFRIVLHDGAFATTGDAIATIATLQPALILTELPADAGSRTALYWLGPVRSDPATRRLAMIGVGEGDEAVAHAADHHIPFSSVAEFRTRAAEILAEHLVVFAGQTVLRQQCDEAPPPLVLKGLHEFNTAEYYECHETLETAWMAERGPVRDLYRVILQVAIAYFQITRGNYSGAHKMFLRTVQWFANLPDHCQGIDVGRLRADADAARAHLETLGPSRIAEFDRSLLKPVVVDHLPDHQNGS